MNKKLLIIFFAILLSVVVVSAAEQQIFSNYVFSDESVVADDKTFVIRLSEFADSSLIQFDDYYLSVDLGSCRTEGVYRACFNESAYDTDKKKHKGLFKIYSLKPDITITRTVDTLNPVMGEEAEFTVVLKNTGGKRVTNVRYEDDFPEGVEIVRTDGGARSDGSMVYWTGSLDADEEEEIGYTIDSSVAFERRLKAEVAFFDGDEDQTVYSSALALDVKPAVEADAKFEDEDYEIPSSGMIFTNGDDEVFLGEEILFVMNLKNNRIDNKSVDTTVLFNFPEVLEYVKTESIKVYRNATTAYYAGGVSIVKQSNGQYKWEGKVVSDRLIVVRFRPKLVGEGVISAKVNYEYEDKMMSDTELFNIEVENLPLYISTNIEDNEDFDSGQEKIVRVWVQNPNDEVDFSDVFVWYNNTLFNESPYTLKTLKRGTSSRIMEKRVFVPASTVDVSGIFNVYANYTTHFGEKFNEELEKDIKIKAIQDLTITHSFIPSTVESGEEVTVKTTIKNDRSIDIPSVHVRDVVPTEFSVIGNNDRFVDINKQDSLDVYTYKIIAPLVAENTEYEVETFVDYRESGIYYNYSEGSTLTVKPKELELTLSQTFSSTDLSKGEIFDVTYTITNSEDELVKDVVVHFPIQQEFDLIGAKTYGIAKIDPGESVTLNNIANYMPKINETQELGETYVWFESAIGAIYNSSISEKSFSKIKDGKISIPSVFVNKTAEINETVLGGEIPIILLFENVGNKEAEISISDSGNNWDITICAGCKRTLTYTIEVDEVGTVMLEPAEIIVNNYNEDIMTSSNVVEIEVKETESSQPVQITPEEDFDDESEVLEAEEDEVPTETEELVQEVKRRSGSFVLIIGVAGGAIAIIFLVISLLRKGKLRKKKEEKNKKDDEEKEDEGEGKKEKKTEKKVRGEGQIDKIAGELERIVETDKEKKKGGKS